MHTTPLLLSNSEWSEDSEAILDPISFEQQEQFRQSQVYNTLVLAAEKPVRDDPLLLEAHLIRQLSSIN